MTPDPLNGGSSMGSLDDIFQGGPPINLGASGQPQPQVRLVQPRPQAPAAPPAQPPDTTDALVKKALEDDPEKDPEYIKAKEGRDKARAAEEKLTGSYVDSLQKMREFGPPPGPPAIREEAPQMRDFAVKAMPWLIIMTAIGGKVAKLSGNNMIGAMTGMLKGAQSGQKQAFDDAYDRWQTNWKRANEDWKNRMAFYDANLKWREGQTTAEGEAARAERELGGAYSGDMKDVVGMHNAQAKAMVALQAQQLKVAQMKERTDIAHASQRVKILDHYQKAEQGLTRLDQAFDAVKDNVGMMNVLIQRYKNQYGDKVVVPGNFAKFIESMSNDPEVGEFVGNIKSLKAALVGIDMPAGSRGNLLLNQLFAGTAPDLFTDSAATIQTKLLRDFNTIAEARDRSQKHLEMWANEFRKEGGSIDQSDFAGSGAKVPESQFPRNTAKTYTNEDIEATAAAHPEMTKAQIIQKLKDLGYSAGT